MSDIVDYGPSQEEVAYQTANARRTLTPAIARDEGLSAFLSSVFRRRSLLVLVCLMSTVFAAAYLRFAVPQFSSTALVLIDQRSNLPLRLSPALSDALTESANIESQVEIVKSERTLQLVVNKEKLVDDQALKPNWLSRSMSSLAHVVPSWMRASSGVAIDRRGTAAAAAALRRRISVQRVGTTFLIDVTATMPDPKQAAAVANSIVEVYIADQQRRREELARRQSELLQQRSEELQRNAQEAESAVEQLKYSGSLSDESSVAAQVKLKDLESLAQTYRVLHDKFLEQSAESWQQQFLAVPDATMASPAFPPLEKSSPHSLLIMACAIAIGLSLGSIAIIWIDRKALGLTS